MTGHRRRRGVTLLELLVAMALFSMLSIAVFWSLRTGLSTLAKTREHTLDVRRAWGAQRALESMLTGLVPLIADYTPPGMAQVQGALFFQGEPTTMRFLSRYSLAGGARSVPVVVELAVIPRPDRDGFRLIANETPYGGPARLGTLIIGPVSDPLTGASFLQFRPVLPGPGSFVVADRLPEGRFFYLDRGPEPTPDLWRERWPMGFLPRAVRIEMGGQRRVTASIYVSTLVRP